MSEGDKKNERTWEGRVHMKGVTLGGGDEVRREVLLHGGGLLSLWVFVFNEVSLLSLAPPRKAPTGRPLLANPRPLPPTSI